MNEKIAIGVLAYNVERYIENVVKELAELGQNIFIINDASTDNTRTILDQLKQSHNFQIIDNKTNQGAGESLKKLINYLSAENYDFLIKVDGDGQFMVNDVEKIIKIYQQNNYEYIKANRFWNAGIIGKIPKKRLFGNLFATLVMQFTLGTNKLYDPLNGLFGVSLKITKFINTKSYPKRYGYPFYITLCCVVNNFKTFQINNTIIYSDQNSNLNPLKVLFTISKLCISFFYEKIRLKKMIGRTQRSAFLDKLFLFSLLFLIVFIGILLRTVVFGRLNLFTPTTNILIIGFLFIITIFTFTLAFREESAFRKIQISNEEKY